MTNHVISDVDIAVVSKEHFLTNIRQEKKFTPSLLECQKGYKNC